MKRVSVVLAVAVCGFLASRAPAALFQYNASAAPNANPDANSGADNVWNPVIPSSNTGNNGAFQGNSASNGDGNGGGAGATAWALYSNGGVNASATSTLAN